MSIFLTSGSAEKTDGELGTEYTAVTNDAATEQVPDRVEGQISANPRPWTNAWFDRTQEIFDEPHNQRTWRESQVSSLRQIQKIHLETRHLSRSLPELQRFPSLHCCSQGEGRPSGATSDDDEAGSDVNTTCAEEESS